MKEVIIQLTEKSRIRIADTEFKGKSYRDVRKQFLNQDEEWCFTSKGIAIPQGLEIQVANAILGKAE